MAKKPSQTEAVRAFLKECGFPDGKWCVATKAPFEHMMELVMGMDLFTRVFACVFLHTMGWLPTSAGIAASKSKGNEARRKQCKELGGILAVTKYYGRTIPLTTAHIAKELNLWALNKAKRDNPDFGEAELRELPIEVDDEDVRRQVVKGEKYGFFVRTNNKDVPLSKLPDADLLRLNSGKGIGDAREDSGTRIYFFLSPLQESTPQNRGLNDGKEHKTGKLPIPELGAEETRQLCFDFADRYQLPEEVVIYAGRRDVAAKLAKLKQQEDELRDLLLKIKAAEDQGLLFPDATTKPASRSKQPQPSETRAEFAPIAAMLDRWHEAWERNEAWEGPMLNYNDTFLGQLVDRCRNESPECTPEEIAWAVNEKLAIKGYKGGPPRGELKNPWGYLMHTVPELFEGDALQRRRRRGMHA